MKRTLAKLKPWSLFIVLFLFLRLPSLFEPYWYGDEAIYLVLGQAIRKGLTLYQHIHDNKPPSLYYLASLAQTVFGFRLILFVWMIPTTFFFYRLAEKYLAKYQLKLALFLFILLSNLPLLESNIANSEIFMLLPTIYAFYIFRSDKRQTWSISALFLGLAFTFKMPALLDALALYFCLFIINLFSTKFSLTSVIKLFFRSLRFWLVFLLPLFVLAIYYWSRQVLPQFIFATFSQNIPYLSSWQTGSHLGSGLNSGIAVRAIIFLFCLICLTLLYYRQKISQHSFSIFIWLSAVIFSVFLSTRPYPHYLIQLIPPLIIGVLLMVPSKNLYSFFIYFSLIFLLFIGIKKYKFYFYPIFSYYQSFYFNIGHLHHFDNSFGQHINQLDLITTHLQSQSVTDGQVFIWGDAPFIYAKLNIVPPVTYTVAYHIVDFNAYDQVIHQLKSSLPRFIVYYPMANRPFTQLDRLISLYYGLDYQVDQILIYKLR